MISFLTKLGVIGGALSGVILINPARVNLDIAKPEKKTEEAPDNKTFETLTDVKLFEKTHGCSFVYVDTWGDKVLYGAREIVEKYENKTTDFEKNIVKGADDAKGVCKTEKGVITLVNNGGWKKQEPKGGWDS